MKRSVTLRPPANSKLQTLFSWQTTMLLQSDTAASIFILLLVLCNYYSRAVFIPLERRHQRRLDKVHTIETVKVARRCQ